MHIVVMILAGLIGIEHLGIMALEMFAKPEMQADSFDMDLEFVKDPSAQVALGNQGIYNGALGVLILLSLFIFKGTTLTTVLQLLMLFITVVGCYGGFTATKKIFLLQMTPALVVLILTFI